MANNYRTAGMLDSAGAAASWVGDAAKAGVRSASDLALDRPIWGTLAGAGVGVGAGELLERMLRRYEETDESFDPSDPEEVRRRAKRRIALLGAGLLLGGGTTAAAMGDRTGFSEGVMPGMSRLMRSIVTRDWRSASPGRAAEQHVAQVASPLSATPAATQFNTPLMPAFNPLLSKQSHASLADPDIEAFEKFAGSIYFDNTIPLHNALSTVISDPTMPQGIKVGMSSLFGQTAQNTGSSWFSGADLARTAVRTGAAAAEGYVLGKTMGTLFALPQRQISQLSHVGAVTDAVLGTGILKWGV
jgi:hypothetical protein